MGLNLCRTRHRRGGGCSAWPGGFRTRPGYKLLGVWTEPAGLRSELRFRPCSAVLNIAAREGSFRLQPPQPCAGKSMPAPLGPAVVPADPPHRAAKQSAGLDCTQVRGPAPTPRPARLEPGMLPRAQRAPSPSQYPLGAPLRWWAAPAAQPRRPAELRRWASGSPQDAGRVGRP